MNSTVDGELVIVNKPLESFIVVIILATLAQILTSCKSDSSSTKYGFTKARISIFEDALNAFKVDVGRFPYTEEGLAALVLQPNGVPNWRGPYIKRREIPRDGWNNQFIYLSPSKHGSGDYDLYSPGQNSIDELGGGDDIVNCL